MFSYQFSAPITEISFSIDNKIEDCYKKLQIRGFTIVEGNIRMGSDKKCVALGYKRLIGDINNPSSVYITNIIGIVTTEKMPNQIYENGVEYYMITDENLNGDINKSSGGFDIYLYYTYEKMVNSPIKELIFTSYREQITPHVDSIKNASISLKSGILDINVGRGKKAGYNYIFIIR